MDKKIALLAVIVLATAALIYLSLAGPPGSLDQLPAVDLSATRTRPELPPGHPEIPGDDSPIEAPDFTISDLSGKSVSLHQLKGKAVLLNFWSTTCFPCIMEMPSLVKLNQLMAGQPFQIMAITADSRKEVEAFLKEMPLDLPIFLDPERAAHEQFGVYMFPESYIVGPEGKVENRVLGAADWSHASVLDYFHKMIAPPAPSPPPPLPAPAPGRTTAP